MVVEATLYTGPVTLDVVGESHYQDALWAIVGGMSDDYVRHDIVAALVPEFDNAYDDNAVAVQIEGRLVGYLPRETAPAYRTAILAHMHEAGRAVAMQGTICGGGWRGDGRGMLGVFLQHDPGDFGIRQRPAQSLTHGSLRTGASELNEGRHDMGWLDALPEADRPAIAQLRTLLETVSDPVGRHFLYAELEHRLYHARDLYAEALDEFDQACIAHDAEMDTIRGELIKALGGVPLLEIYRQACIRAAKAHRFDDTERWAARGLDVYGTEALREQDVEDLTKRLNQARAKAAAAPRTATPKRVHLPAPAAAPTVETLTCARCGETFERELTRGRKPSLCPTCR